MPSRRPSPWIESHARPPGEVDYRFTLANERTFLAWIRTALALLAGGLAVRELVSTFDVGWARTALAVACILLSVAITVLGYRQWLESQRAMRAGEALPRSPGVRAAQHRSCRRRRHRRAPGGDRMIDPDEMVGGGLQPERTELAWLRTGLGASGLVLLAAHLGATEHGIPWPVVVAVITLALACVSARHGCAGQEPAAATRHCPRHRTRWHFSARQC